MTKEQRDPETAAADVRLTPEQALQQTARSLGLPDNLPPSDLIKAIRQALDARRFEDRR